jgi:hypothetical protein
MELINRQMLISHMADWRFAEAPWSEPKELPKEYTALDMQRMIYRTIGDAMSAVDDAPAVDAVEVVRCRDCEFYTGEDRWCRRLGLVGAFDKNDYCSHAERRKDEAD